MAAFPIAFALSSIAGLLWLAWVSPNGRTLEESEPEAASRVRFDAGLWSLLGGFLGARIAFVLAHATYYGSHPMEVLQVWQGGLSWPGAAVGALLALFLYSLITKRSYWDLADALAGPVALLSFWLWIGCRVDHCAYGVGGQFGPLAVVSPDIFGVVSSRWPTQAVGAQCSALLLTGVILLRGRLPRSGMLASITLTFLAAEMLLLSLTRGDPVGVLWGWRLDTLGSAAILAVAISGLMLRSWRK